MGFLQICLIIAIFLLCSVVGWYISISNSVNRIKLKVEETLSGVEIQLRQRYDVLMQGKIVTEQYAKREQQVFESLSHLKEIPRNATVDQLNEASKTQEEAVRGIFALGEAYPELKSAEIFNNLSDKLADQSQQYSAARRAVNGNITRLNTYVVTFPSSIVCGMKSVTKMDYIHEENLEQIKSVDMTMNI